MNCADHRPGAQGRAGLKHLDSQAPVTDLRSGARAMLTGQYCDCLPEYFFEVWPIDRQVLIGLNYSCCGVSLGSVFLRRVVAGCLSSMAIGQTRVPMGGAYNGIGCGLY